MTTMVTTKRTSTLDHEYRAGGTQLYWRWFCPVHQWYGPWEMARDSAYMNGWVHDIDHHGLVDPDDEDDDR